MIALDASVLVAFLRVADRHHEAAVRVLVEDDGLTVHQVNLAEALVAPVRAGREAEALGAWGRVGIEVWRSEADEAVGLARLRVETPLRLPDCCPVLVAERVGARLATFDGRLASTARDRGIEVLGADV